MFVHALDTALYLHNSMSFNSRRNESSSSQSSSDTNTSNNDGSPEEDEGNSFYKFFESVSTNVNLFAQSSPKIECGKSLSTLDLSDRSDTSLNSGQSLGNQRCLRVGKTRSSDSITIHKSSTTIVSPRSDEVFFGFYPFKTSRWKENQLNLNNKKGKQPYQNRASDLKPTINLKKSNRVDSSYGMGRESWENQFRHFKSKISNKSCNTKLNHRLNSAKTTELSFEDEVQSIRSEGSVSLNFDWKNLNWDNSLSKFCSLVCSNHNNDFPSCPDKQSDNENLYFTMEDCLTQSEQHYKSIFVETILKSQKGEDSVSICEESIIANHIKNDASNIISQRPMVGKTYSLQNTSKLKPLTFKKKFLKDGNKPMKKTVDGQKSTFEEIERSKSSWSIDSQQSTYKNNMKTIKSLSVYQALNQKSEMKSYKLSTKSPKFLAKPLVAGTVANKEQPPIVTPPVLISKGYKFINLVANGTFCTLYETVRNQDAKNIVACKHILYAELASKEKVLAHCIDEEIAIMKLTNHPNIIELFETVKSPTDYFIIMKFAVNGTVHRKPSMFDNNNNFLIFFSFRSCLRSLGSSGKWRVC